MLKTRHIGAYRDLLVLFTRYGRKDFRLTMSPDDLLLPVEEETKMEPDVRQRAEAFASALKQMGPAYVKFGQLLSRRRCCISTPSRDGSIPSTTRSTSSASTPSS